MRLWLVKPEILCRNHLLGEHKEIHMFAGALEKHKNLSGYLLKNCLEPTALISRHDVLVVEMTKRGYKHQTPLKRVNLSYLDKTEKNILIDKEAALLDLIDRCPECAKNYVFTCVETFSNMYMNFIPKDIKVLSYFPRAMESASKAPLDTSGELALTLFENLLNSSAPKADKCTS